MGVSMYLATRVEHFVDDETLQRLADTGPCEHFSVLSEDRSSLRVYRRGVPVTGWAPAGLAEASRLSAFPGWDDAEYLEGCELYAPGLNGYRPSLPWTTDLRRFGLPYAEVRSTDDLMYLNRDTFNGVPNLTDIDPEFEADVRRMVRFCLRYGTMIRVGY